MNITRNYNLEQLVYVDLNDVRLDTDFHYEKENRWYRKSGWYHWGDRYKGGDIKKHPYFDDEKHYIKDDSIYVKSNVHMVFSNKSWLIIYLNSLNEARKLYNEILMSRIGWISSNGNIIPPL